MDFKKMIREIPDYPKPGINFKDITPLLLMPEAVQNACGEMTAPFAASGADFVAGIEARGFIFGSVAAQAMGLGFIPVRKSKKLPGPVLRQEYDLEYGKDAVEVHQGQIPPGSKILIVDDVLATGGTVSAACSLFEKAACEVVGFSFLIELSFLHGREKLKGKSVFSLITY